MTTNKQSQGFTPGPWRAEIKRGAITIWPKENDAICEVYHGYQDEQAEANAHLIASAPELLEACKLAEKFLDLTPDEMRDSEQQGQEAWEAVRQAIAKAEGRK